MRTSWESNIEGGHIGTLFLARSKTWTLTFSVVPISLTSQVTAKMSQHPFRYMYSPHFQAIKLQNLSTLTWVGDESSPPTGDGYFANLVQTLNAWIPLRRMSEELLPQTFMESRFDTIRLFRAQVIQNQKILATRIDQSKLTENPEFKGSKEPWK